MQHVQTIFQILRDHQLQVKENKSYFGQSSVPYLGFLVNSEGIQPDPARIQALQNWPLPSSASELKSFMGGINFYRKFIMHFSEIAHSLHQLSNTSATFLCTIETISNFNKLKKSLFSAPVLHLRDLSQPFEITSRRREWPIL